MAKPFSDLTKGFSPKRKAQIEVLKQEMLVELDLATLRKALSLTQAAVAEALNVQQAEVSRIEKRTDVLLSTMRKYIEAVGGRLEIHAVFPGNTVIISDLAGLRSTAADAAVAGAE